MRERVFDSEALKAARPLTDYLKRKHSPQWAFLVTYDGLSIVSREVDEHSEKPHMYNRDKFLLALTVINVICLTASTLMMLL